MQIYRSLGITARLATGTGCRTPSRNEDCLVLNRRQQREQSRASRFPLFPSVQFRQESLPRCSVLQICAKSTQSRGCLGWSRFAAWLAGQLGARDTVFHSNSVSRPPRAKRQPALHWSDPSHPLVRWLVHLEIAGVMINAARTISTRPFFPIRLHSICYAIGIKSNQLNNE